MNNSKVTKNNELSKESICEAIREYCESKGLSQNELATKSGVSGATINKILNGKWNDISDILWRKMWNVVCDAELQMIDTSDHSLMQDVCKIARKNKLMVGLLGNTGMGKTTSLKYLSRSRNTFYVVYKKTMKSKHFFSAVLKEMGIAYEGSVFEMVNRISDELNTLSNPLLIIDECGKITNNIMLYLHDLRDNTINKCGIVLAGMPYFKANLIKNSVRQKEGFAEFFRRINVWYELQGLTRKEIDFICNQNGITEKEELKEFYNKRQFGDLTNSLQHYQLSFASTLINL